MSALCGWVRYCCCAESRPSARRVPVVETFTGTWLTIFLAIFSHKTCQTKRFNGVKDNQFSHSQIFHYMKSRSFWTTTLNGSFTRWRRVFVQWIYYIRLMGITTTLIIILGDMPFTSKWRVQDQNAALLHNWRCSLILTQYIYISTLKFL